VLICVCVSPSYAWGCQGCAYVCNCLLYLFSKMLKERSAVVLEHQAVQWQVLDHDGAMFIL